MSEKSKKEILAGLDRPLRIGTRQSPLAMAQAEMTANALLSTHGWRPEQVELVPMIASGDKILDRALADVGGKALWTKELDHALGGGEIDCSVHSMKDVETIRPEEFILAAMLERADIHDRLIGAESIDALSERAIVGTASPRRKAQLLRQRSDLDIRLIRGNVQTRLQKIADGEYDATLLAAAGLNRLEMDDVGSEISDEIMLPAPAQGAVGIETRSDDRHMRHLMRAISSGKTFRAVIAERLFLKQLTADCHSPVAALATIDGAKACLRAEILLPDGSEFVAGSSHFDIGDVSAPAILADKLLGQASAELQAIFGK
ncbi:MAG: hydroxymethylbilane synthase [Sphingomonadales bacterium]|nr:hydroxymethylbilane synthase [Sphingomonadales bacterium]PIX67240.1 MAG: hydroxymethylbilane synthase [Sphingomonadales bacterium CG_4_10_14_3_um_filter_58_15]NCO48679.1 hydroxymethylbilane synthase [Sphingomonadales bacterium]NCO99576.1 hydroxymethylbilane synthase [Sphingomonadales bacterium]NCP25954.1 hydroxymethylbilane synthase [Sphingomonadales bacterium]